jgi:phenylpyruvate tautomerase PptA (4-oxalocrotonate tautomerase family)
VSEATGRFSLWRPDAIQEIDQATAQDLSARTLELRGRSEDEEADRSTYLALLGIASGERAPRRDHARRDCGDHTGSPAEQRRQITVAITDAMVRIGKTTADQVHIVFQDVEKDHWGANGKLASD